MLRSHYIGRAEEDRRKEGILEGVLLDSRIGTWGEGGETGEGCSVQFPGSSEAAIL